MPLAATACRNHPGRPGIGVCPSCATPVCEECSTRVDGILHCRACLASKASAEARPPWRSLSAVLPALVLTPLAWLGVSGLLYLLSCAVAILPWLKDLQDKMTS